MPAFAGSVKLGALSAEQLSRVAAKMLEITGLLLNKLGGKGFFNLQTGFNHEILGLYGAFG